MPTFDVVSEIDLHEVANAVDQASREVGTRFDFKGSSASFELKAGVITLSGDNEFQLQQMRDILQPRLAKRGIDLLCLRIEPAKAQGRGAIQTITLQQGIDVPMAKEMIKILKESKIKVQASIQGDQVRVSGKKRDDLQEAIAHLKAANVKLPLQFTNFRD